MSEDAVEYVVHGAKQDTMPSPVDKDLAWFTEYVKGFIRDRFPEPLDNYPEFHEMVIDIIVDAFHDGVVWCEKGREKKAVGGGMDEPSSSCP